MASGPVALTVPRSSVSQISRPRDGETFKAVTLSKKITLAVTPKEVARNVPNYYPGKVANLQALVV